MKVKKSIKDAAKRGQVDVAKILAKEVVQSKKAVSKLYASKAQMNSVVMSMQQQLGTVLIRNKIWLVRKTHRVSELIKKSFLFSIVLLECAVVYMTTGWFSRLISCYARTYSDLFLFFFQD